MPALDLASDDERLQSDIVLPGADLVKSGGMQPPNELVRPSIVRVELGQLSAKGSGCIPDVMKTPPGRSRS
jgi:hypothetical protein